MRRVFEPECRLPQDAFFFVLGKRGHGGIIACGGARQRRARTTRVVASPKPESRAPASKKNSIVLAPGYSSGAGLGPSTIAAGGLNCCVRDGNRCTPAALSTKTMKFFGSYFGIRVSGCCGELRFASPKPESRTPNQRIIRTEYRHATLTHDRPPSLVPDGRGIGLLVPLGLSDHSPYTCGLSTSSSRRALNESLSWGRLHA
jgi:hypothetical protein